GHGSFMRGSRRARRASGPNRIDRGARGNQASPRRGPSAYRQDGLFRHAVGSRLRADSEDPQGPEVPGLQRESHAERTYRLRGILRTRSRQRRRGGEPRIGERCRRALIEEGWNCRRGRAHIGPRPFLVSARDTGNSFPPASILISSSRGTSRTMALGPFYVAEKLKQSGGIKGVALLMRHGETPWNR